ncbi:probable nucleoredoxin 1-2 [Exaiptasia diaphana]|uniref:Thioredoxin domain-containing protein n=1 Tax=Exaiptasia diaphana TaxID=2652724 RepID=A0A913Y699_EXADI|nr:probable nucleoredoxin 1-2 [Exaiptasia diaphana]
MGVFTDEKIMDKDGNLVDAEPELTGKVILVYFSAHWCPPCRGFTPMLKDCYEDLEGKPLAIVFVSSDRSKEEMDSYYKESHGEWYRAQHGSELANKLKENCNVRGIPTLAVVDGDGNMLDQSARSDVETGPPSKAFEKWQKLSQK